MECYEQLLHLNPTDQYLFSLFGRGPTSRSTFPTVHAAVLHHASQQPDAVAVRDLSSATPRSLTYAELVRHAYRLAKTLLDSGIQPGSRVPLLVRRSTEMVVGILGILMAGAQYVPLDGGVVPDKTLQHVFRSSCAEHGTVLCTSVTRARAENFIECRNLLVLDEIMSENQTSSPDAPHSPQQLRDALLGDTNSGCYVIYTSGTTGEPKGVDVTHSNVTNLVCNAPGNVGMQPGMRVGSVLSISFDMGAWEILGALCNGCMLVLRGSDWKQVLQEIDVLISTPTILSGFDPREFPNIKFVATAGEPLPQRTADDWTSAGKVLFSGCGPTEVTIVNTINVHAVGEPVSIGKPTPNNTVYVLDEDERPVPIGEHGIMWAGGAGISRGYINLPEKTAERWKYDPFARDGSYMFNTGDIGYWLPNGTLQIVGRMDDQVKIKGFRVELDGVSTSLRSCPGVSAAVALMVKNKLCAFVTPSTCSIADVMKDMKARQPYYAVPSYCQAVEELPKTNNGKIDKSALRELAWKTHGLDEVDSVEHPTASQLCTPNTALSVRSSSAPPSEKSADPGSPKALEIAKHISTASVSSSSTLAEKAEHYPLPEKRTGKLLRGLRFRILIVYRTLFSLVWLSNIVVALLFVAFHFNPTWLSTISLINFTVAVLARQDHVINIIYTVVCSIPKTWPLWIRRRAGKIYHFGGMHSGAASAAVGWYIAGLVHQTVSRSKDPFRLKGTASAATLAISWMTIVLLVLIMATAYPRFRKAYHDLFERIHRFIGWTVLGFIWIQTILAINDTRYGQLVAHGSSRSLASMVFSSPNFWLLVVITCSIATSWLYLRRVTVDAEVLSSHAVRLHFDYVVPVNGSFTRVSLRPLLEWHSFATVPAPYPTTTHAAGYSLVVSNAGDWTKAIIQKPQTKLWVRGVPTCGVMRISTLFNRLVLVGTGSGIGPLLGFVQHPIAPFRLVWSTKDPQKTFGPELCDEIQRQDPQAVIHDTNVHGRPDLVKLVWDAVQAFDAEAVIVISNERLTRKVVYGMETRGVAAFGAIWDS